MQLQCKPFSSLFCFFFLSLDWCKHWLCVRGERVYTLQHIGPPPEAPSHPIYWATVHAPWGKQHISVGSATVATIAAMLQWQKPPTGIAFRSAWSPHAQRTPPRRTGSDFTPRGQAGSLFLPAHWWKRDMWPSDVRHWNGAYTGLLLDANANFTLRAEPRCPLSHHWCSNPNKMTNNCCLILVRFFFFFFTRENGKRTIHSAKMEDLLNGFIIKMEEVNWIFARLTTAIL